MPGGEGSGSLPHRGAHTQSRLLRIGRAFRQGDAWDRLHNPYGADGGAGDQGSTSGAWRDQRGQLRRGHHRSCRGNPERGLRGRGPRAPRRAVARRQPYSRRREGWRSSRTKGRNGTGEEGSRAADQRPQADIRGRRRSGHGHGAGKRGDHLRRRTNRVAAGPLAGNGRHVGEGHRERDEARARYVASQLRKGFVLHDEGISRDFLLQEGVDRTDAFVAVTGDDRANLLAAMYARQLGARMTIAGISRGEFAPLADALGVDLTISPRMLAAEAILRFVRKGEVIDVALLASGAEMIELRVPESCRVAGQPLSEVGFPEGAIVGALLRDGTVVIPTGREVLRPGDDAVVFTVEGAVEEVENLFAP